MIPELEALVDTGIVTKDATLALINNLSEKELEEFIESIPTDKKILSAHFFTDLIHFSYSILVAIGISLKLSAI